MKLRVVIVVPLIVTIASLAVAQDNTKAAQAAAEAWLRLVDWGTMPKAGRTPPPYSKQR